MRILKRILKNIKWCIFNHPPTPMVENLDPEAKCDYCERTRTLWTRTNENGIIFTICACCEKKTYDAILGKP